jgi:exodeoxyribonuclease VII large subunit
MDGEAAKSGETGSNITEFSVSEISGQLKRVVEDTFGRVRVRGEIAGYRGPHSSGHMYFALKDERARIEAVVWRGVTPRLKYRPEEGMEVIATGKLSTYPGTSKYQIIIDQLEPAGAGALMALLEERKKKLGVEGLFAPERKQLIPFLPKVVGVVTSPTGSVIRDILHRLTDRFPLHVVVWPVRVQGETSGNEVAAAIRGFNHVGPQGPIPVPDVIIVARGGGSIEDLWGFNDEAVVRAAAESAIPTISAVGHETDWTLIDLAADLRVPTPTAAAEMAVPIKADLEAGIADLAARLKSGLRRKLDAATTELRSASRGLPSPDSLFALKRQHLDQISGNLDHRLVVSVQGKRFELQRVAGKLGPSLLMQPIERRRQTLEFTGNQLGRNMRRRLETASSRLAEYHLRPSSLVGAIELASGRLDHLGKTMRTAQRIRMESAASRLEQASRLLVSYSHQRTLERGFALVRKPDGGLVSRAAQSHRGDVYDLQFADGSVKVSRGADEDDDKKASSAASAPSDPKQKTPQPPRKKPSAGAATAQTNLFGD